MISVYTSSELWPLVKSQLMVTDYFSHSCGQEDHGPSFFPNPVEMLSLVSALSHSLKKDGISETAALRVDLKVVPEKKLR